MSFLLSSPPTNVSAVTYGFAGIAVILAVTKLARPSKLDAIPTVGPRSWFGPWWDAFKFVANGMEIIQEGYEKYQSAPFKVSTPSHWAVILCSREHVEEMRRAPDDALSSAEGANEQIQMEYTMGAEIHHNPYHISIVRSQLTRNIGGLYPEIRSEIITALDDLLDLKGNEWKSLPVVRSVQDIVCRTSNRIFVGLPLCRDPDWTDLNIHYAIYVAKAKAILMLFPKFLKPLAIRLFTDVVQSRQRAEKLVGPMIEERLKYLNEYGNQWTDKPNDFLSWLIEEAEGPELTVKYLTNRLLGLNFAAIHTTSLSFSHALFYLLANPQYIQPLREEVDQVIENEGWSKAALGKMRKVDSFLKECQRMEGVNYLSTPRKALQDFTFSDGTFVPKGTMLLTAAGPIHYDQAFYENARTFEPFRFANLRDEDGEGVKHHFVSTAPDFLPFGHGRHACPGRFFAVTEMKTLLAHIVVTYDIKLEDNARRPQALHFLTANVPDRSAKVMFRRRVD